MRYDVVVASRGDGQHACRTVTAYYPIARVQKIWEVIAATTVEVQYLERVVPTKLALDHLVEEPLRETVCRVESGERRILLRCPQLRYHFLC